MQAVLGKITSGVVVATTIKSSAEGGRSAAASARLLASRARSLALSLSAAMWRCLIPVRV
jgi:hypothetical protein